MTGVQGIGGVFIDSSDAQRLAAWYEQVLGITMELHPDRHSYYHVFQTRDVETMVLRQNPVFAIQQASGELSSGGRGFVINLRVDDLDNYLDLVRSNGVRVEDKMLIWEGGKHAWIADADGNRIELYEEIIMEQ